MTDDASRRAAANRRRGSTAELAVARYLRTVGFPGAERAVRTGYRTATRTSPDPGDIAGIPGLVISVKDAQVERLTSWLTEVRVMTATGGELGLLVHKRRGHANPANWWCWLRFRDALALAFPTSLGTTGTYVGPAGDDPIRMQLSHVIPLLHGAGYGTPPDHERTRR
ncbi:hypothetical protein [Pseudonocardia sp.]|uniref:hypothetical protein n=1 Tax=Pseudonocardia sp. TaxID=60912 RepID=UPI003D1175AB